MRALALGIVLSGLLTAGCSKQELEEKAQLEPAVSAPASTERKRDRPPKGLASKAPVSQNEGMTRPRPKAPPAMASMRAGASRLTAYHGKPHEVPFEGDRELRMAEVDRARGGRRLGARMGPFVAREGTAPKDHVDVEKGPESVRAALARQLQVMGWEVLEAAPDAEDRDKNAEKKKGRQLLTRFAFQGKVSFRLKSGPKAATATVDGEIEVLDARGREVHRSHVKTPETVTKAQQGRITPRSKEAQKRALAAFVRRFFSDAELSKKLVKAIQAAGKGKQG